MLRGTIRFFHLNGTDTLWEQPGIFVFLLDNATESDITSQSKCAIMKEHRHQQCNDIGQDDLGLNDQMNEEQSPKGQGIQRSQV